jgi:hypothetical protein
MFLTSSWRSGAPKYSAQPPTMLEAFILIAMQKILFLLEFSNNDSRICNRFLCSVKNLVERTLMYRKNAHWADIVVS